MKYLSSIVIWIFFLLSSCYGVNEKNSYFFTLSTCCNSNTMWTNIYEKYKPKNTEALNVNKVLEDFKSQPFRTNVIYFDEEPKEYIGISENGRFIRYVYNEKLANQVLDGLSPQLNDSEKIRIGLRINSLLFNYLNEEGRKESILLIGESCNEFIENHRD